MCHRRAFPATLVAASQRTHQALPATFCYQALATLRRNVSPTNLCGQTLAAILADSGEQATTRLTDLPVLEGALAAHHVSRLSVTKVHSAALGRAKMALPIPLWARPYMRVHSMCDVPLRPHKGDASLLEAPIVCVVFPYGNMSAATP